MFKKNNILKDLPVLEAQGLIDEATKERLQGFYSKEEKEAEKLSPLAVVKALSLYLIGAIFAIIGGYMFIDYNWSGFPNVIKVILMFAPLVISVPLIFYALKKPSILADCIALAVNFIGLILALLAPSVIYNASGAYLDFITALVFLFCPLLVIIRQPLGLILGACLMIALKLAIFSYHQIEFVSISSLGYVFFVSIFLYQVLSVKERLSYGFVAKIFATFLLAISLIIADNSRDLCESFFIMNFALCAYAVYAKREVLFLLAITLFAFLACILSSLKGNLSRGHYDFLFQYDLFVLLLAIALIVFGTLCVGLAIYKKRKAFPIAIACALLIHVIVFMLLPLGKDIAGFNISSAIKIWCTISVLSIFALLYFRGIKEKSLLLLNEAFALIMLYAIFKLNDNYWTLAGRSALFFGIGIAMIVSNKILNRKISQNEAN